jgi:DNA-binding MurR/RpiR family transcriptional regulator
MECIAMSYEERIRGNALKCQKVLLNWQTSCSIHMWKPPFMTASELAHTLDLDAATVVRFSQSLGYKGFPQLQREIRQKVKGDLLIRPSEAEVGNSVPGVAAITLRELAKDLEQTTITLDTTALTNLVDLIGQARRIIVLADPPAQPAAYNLLYFLEQGGFSIFIARYGAVDLARTIHTARRT